MVMEKMTKSSFEARGSKVEKGDFMWWRWTRPGQGIYGVCGEVIMCWWCVCVGVCVCCGANGVVASIYEAAARAVRPVSGANGVVCLCC